MSRFYYQAYLLSLCLSIAGTAQAAIKEYHLQIAESQVTVNGTSYSRITVNSQFPAPMLEFEEGDDAVIHVHNQLTKQQSSVHWHGLLLSGMMDGVPGFNRFQGIAPGEKFSYRFKIRQQGTYWYHAHSKGQEQDGLYGAFIIYPKQRTKTLQHLVADVQTQQDYVVMLSDFHPQPSAQIEAHLKKSADWYQNQRETLSDLWQQLRHNGVKQTWAERQMWNRMRMLRTDLSDVTGYTFLINGKTPEQTWTGLYQPQEFVRLRFINASAMSFYDVRVPGLKMTVISADGQAVKPITVDEFRIGAAETYDVVVQPAEAQYQIQAESIDRSGFALGRLQLQGVAVQPISMPEPRPRAQLSMMDMGHGRSKSLTMNKESVPHSGAGHEEDDKKLLTAHPSAHYVNRTAANHAHQTGQTEQPEVFTRTQLAQQSKIDRDVVPPHLSHGKDPHGSMVEGWGNAATPAGHKALRYSDLQALWPQPDQRQPERELEIRLGGNMERYMWTINGQKMSEAQPLQLNHGERVRLKFINDSMMAHPMHLHGMFMQLENGQSSANMPNKHTIIIAPGQTVSALLTANEVGEWALHCHLLFHMSAGMMSKLIVAHVKEQPDRSQSEIPHVAGQSGGVHVHH